MVSYADDSVLLHSAPPTADGLLQPRQNVEGDLETLSQWFRSNGLKVNPNKTDMSLVGTPSAVKKAANFRLTFEGITLEPADHIKILGVILDQNLSMEKQTARVVQRGYGTLTTLKKLRGTLLLSFVLPPSTMETLVRSLVMPQCPTSRTACLRRLHPRKTYKFG